MGEQRASEERKRPKSARFASLSLPLGLVAVLAGCVIAWSNAGTSANVGWFAYAPLSNQLYSGNAVTFVSQGTQIGLAAAVVGLLLLAFWTGHHIGGRSKPKKPG